MMDCHIIELAFQDFEESRLQNSQSILIMVKVVTIWTNLAKNQETLIYMVKTFVQIVMSSTIYGINQEYNFLNSRILRH